MLGRIAGGAVRLAPLADGTALGICEGIETGLAVMTACPGLAVWATLSTSGLEQVQLPPEASASSILADHDESGAGLRAAETAARRLRTEGREVAIALPPEGRTGFQRPAACARAGGREGSPSPRRLPNQKRALPEIGQHRPLNYLRDGDRMFRFMRADEGDLARAVEQDWSCCSPPTARHGCSATPDMPTWVVPDDEGRPVAATLTEDRLRHMLARLARWVRENAKGELTPAPPPVAVVKSRSRHARSRRSRCSWASSIRRCSAATASC